jgi:endonuclease/exonuclease/phosphatase family metal-dependent hydrolase
MQMHHTEHPHVFANNLHMRTGGGGVQAQSAVVSAADILTQISDVEVHTRYLESELHATEEEWRATTTAAAAASLNTAGADQHGVSLRDGSSEWHRGARTAPNPSDNAEDDEEGSHRPHLLGSAASTLALTPVLPPPHVAAAVESLRLRSNDLRRRMSLQQHMVSELYRALVPTPHHDVALHTTSMSREPSRPLSTIRVMTLNMLYDGHYRRFLKTTDTLDAQRRADMAIQFIVSQTQAREDRGGEGGTVEGGLPVDVFALQECDLKSGLGLDIVRALPDYTFIYPPTTVDESVALLYNHRKLMPVGFPVFTPFVDIIASPSLSHSYKILSKGVLHQLFELRGPTTTSRCAASPQPQRVTIASAHVPYGAEPSVAARCLFDLYQQLTKPDNQKYILCGDFNATVYGRSADAFRATFADGSQYWSEATRSLAHTARSPSERYEKIDCIFHTTNEMSGFQLVPEENSLTLVPQDSVNLLPHAVNGRMGKHPFFSDHAAIAVTFRLEPRAAQQQQQQHQVTPSGSPRLSDPALARCWDAAVDMNAYRSALPASGLGALVAPRPHAPSHSQPA